MNFRQAVTHVRRRMGIFLFNSKEDFEYLLEREYQRNKELYDRLAKL